MRPVALLAALLALSGVGCTESYDDQRQGLQDYMKAHRQGSSPDYFLVKMNLGQPDRVALIFGMLDDLSYCQELAEMYVEKHPLDTYTCLPANMP